MQKIGLLGGTFNPIHNAHLLLAETAREAYQLDRVIFMPSGCSYMKDPGEILPGYLRLEMVGIATKDNPDFTVSDMEIKRKGNSYTCDTLQELHISYPDAQIYHIIGADTLFRIEEWKSPELIFQSCITLAAVREGFMDDKLQEQADYLNRKYQTQIHLLPSLHMEISSTDIRQRCREGRSVRYLMPAPLWRFIEENGIYR